MINKKDFVVASALSVLCLCMQAQATDKTFEIPTGKTNIIISSSLNSYDTSTANKAGTYYPISATSDTTIKLNANSRIDATSLYSGISTPALMINADVADFKLKKIYIDGTIDGRSMSGANENGLEIVGFDTSKNNQQMTVTDGLHFGPNAKIIGSNNSAFVIKDITKFIGNITNDGKLGDKTSGLGFTFQKPIEGNIINNGTIEGHHYGLKIDGTINGIITNNGTIITHTDDRVHVLPGDLHSPAAIYVQNTVKNLEFINHGIIKGRRSFYDKHIKVAIGADEWSVKLTNHGYIEGWFDCISDTAVIINEKSGTIIGPEIDAAFLTNSGKIIVRPESVVEQPNPKAKLPEIALKVTEKLIVAKDATVEINGEYWPAKKTINNGVFKVTDIRYGHSIARTDLILENNGIFIVEKIIPSKKTGLLDLAITNSKELSMHQGNSIKSYADNNGKLQIVFSSLSGPLLKTIDNTKFSDNSIIELKPNNLTQLDSDAKRKDISVVIVESGASITANANIVKSGHLLLQISSVKNENNTLSATLHFLSPSTVIDKKEMSEADVTFADNLFDNNEPANKKVIDLIIQAYGDISQATTPEEIKKYIEAITPEKADVARDVVSAMSSQSESTVVNHISSVRSGVSTGDTKLMQDVAVWGQVILNKGKKDPTTSSSGYDSDFKGFALGVEHDFNQMIYGIAWSYVAANAKLDNSKNKSQNIDVNMNSVSLYLNKSINKLFFEGVINAGRTKHSIQSGQSAMLAEGSYYSNQCQLQVASGVNFTLAEFNIEPKIALKLGAVYSDGYTLKTASGISTTSKADSNIRQLDAGFGLKVMRNIKSEKLTILPHASAMYYHNIFKNNNGEQQIVFANHKFNSVVDEIKNNFSSEFGANFIYKNIEFNTNYSINWKKNFYAHNVSMMLKYKF